MFPHQKLDWNISRHERHLETQPDDTSVRLELATACLSKALFHDGGEVWLNRALTQARRALQDDPDNPTGLVVAGYALVSLDRLDPAMRYLDEALKRDPERAELHLALGAFYRRQGDRHQALRELEMACRLAPDSWEGHALLGQVLWERAKPLGYPRRLVERSQYHTVRALQQGATPGTAASMQFHLAMTCLHLGRHQDANALLTPLTDNPRFAAKAKLYLGQVLYNLGKYKNAILYLRQHLDQTSDPAPVLARLGQCYLQLGEVEKARQCCIKALAMDPALSQARWTLGCALLEDQQKEEAERTFKELLGDEPDHVPAFTEMVRLHADQRDTTWLRRALRAEVSRFDRQPLEVTMDGRHVAPRKSTRNRIAILSRFLGQVDKEAVTVLLDSLDLTTDEGLRLLLWEAALEHTATRRARALKARLEDPGTGYSAAAGREALSLSMLLPEQLLMNGLQVEEQHLKRAAVDRHGPARDVTAHRRTVEAERQEARAWQALILLTLATHNSDTARTLLVRWANEADADLADAARAGLVILGDQEAARVLKIRATRHQLSPKVDALLGAAAPAETWGRPKAVSGEGPHVCATCQRRMTEVDHMIVGRGAAVCDRCMTEIARHRRDLETEDPEARCALSGHTPMDDKAVYLFEGVHIAASCVEQSLGLTEREEVDRFLAAH